MSPKEQLQIAIELERLIPVYMSLRQNAQALKLIGMKDFADTLCNYANTIEDVQMVVKEMTRS